MQHAWELRLQTTPWHSKHSQRRFCEIRRNEMTKRFFRLSRWTVKPDVGATDVHMMNADSDWQEAPLYIYRKRDAEAHHGSFTPVPGQKLNADAASAELLWATPAFAFKLLHACIEENRIWKLYWGICMSTEFNIDVYIRLGLNLKPCSSLLEMKKIMIRYIIM